MLTRFFRNSSLGRTLLIPLSAVLIYFFIHFYDLDEDFTPVRVLKEGVAFIGFLASAYLTNRLGHKNHSKIRGNLMAFLYVLLCFCLPFSLIDENIVISALWILLGLRRISALQKQRNVSQKIFDSFFLTSIGVIFFPPAVFFFLVLFVYIGYFTPFNFRHFLIPFTAFVSIWILITTYELLIHNRWFSVSDLFRFEVYPLDKIADFQPLIWPLSFLFIFLLYCIIRPSLSLSGKRLIGKKQRMVMTVLFAASLLTLSFSYPYTTEGIKALYFLFIPMTITIGSYFSSSPYSLLKEILLSVFILGCLFFALNFNFHFIS